MFSPQVSSALFFQYNTQLGPPYHILLDTNFVNFSIKYKLDVIQNMMDCLYAKCIPYVTDCVMGEMEKLGQKYKIALKIMKDSRFERLSCLHKGTYADDCLVQRVTQVSKKIFSYLLQVIHIKVVSFKTEVSGRVLSQILKYFPIYYFYCFCLLSFVVQPRFGTQCAWYRFRCEGLKDWF